MKVAIGNVDVTGRARCGKMRDGGQEIKKKKRHASPHEAVDLVTAAPFDRLLQPSCLSRAKKKQKKNRQTC